MRSTQTDATTQKWLPDEKPGPAGLPLHRIGWLLRRDTIWAVVDNRPVAAYPSTWDLAASTNQLTLEIDGGSDQTVEIAGVRLLAGPVHSAATRAAQVAGRTRAANEQAATQRAEAATQRAEAALARPAARPTGLTLLAELQGETLRAELERRSNSPLAGLQLAAEQVVLTGNGMWQSGGFFRLPESFRTVYLDRLTKQPLYFECRGQLLGAGTAAPTGQFALSLSTTQSTGDLALEWAPSNARWRLRHGATSRTGPVSEDMKPHTLGLLLAGDSATVYFDDKVLPGKTFVGTITKEPNPQMPLFLSVWLGTAQTLRLDYTRLSAQGEAEAIAARQAAALTLEAQARQAAQEQAARDIAARTASGSGSNGRPPGVTPGGVQYSTADMSMFERKPGAVSGYSTGAGAASNKCARCNGFGKVNTRSNNCTYCRGTGGATGFVPARTWTERGPTGKEYHYQSTDGKQQWVACSHCAGGPTPVWEVCSTCHGTGH